MSEAFGRAIAYARSGRAPCALRSDGAPRSLCGHGHDARRGADSAPAASLQFCRVQQRNFACWHSCKMRLAGMVHCRGARMFRLDMETYAAGDEALQWCWPNCNVDATYLAALDAILSWVATKHPGVQVCGARVA